MRRQREAMIAMQTRDPSSQPMKYQDHQKSPYPYAFKDDVPQQGQHLSRNQHQGQHQGQYLEYILMFVFLCTLHFRILIEI